MIGYALGAKRMKHPCKIERRRLSGNVMELLVDYLVSLREKAPIVYLTEEQI